jgi:uncharacterized protein YdhG (YjbR/CyaY superfamily)
MKGDARVEVFLARLPRDQRDALARLRTVIRSAAPDATETINYGIPMWRLNGKGLVSMTAGKKHLSFFVQSYAVLEKYSSEIEKYKVEKATMAFTPEKPLPVALICKIVKARVREVEQARAKG